MEIIARKQVVVNCNDKTTHLCKGEEMDVPIDTAGLLWAQNQAYITKGKSAKNDKEVIADIKKLRAYFEKHGKTEKATAKKALLETVK